MQDILAVHPAPAWQVSHELVGGPASGSFKGVFRGVVHHYFLPPAKRDELHCVGDDDLGGGIHPSVADFDEVVRPFEQDLCEDEFPLRLPLLVKRALGLVQKRRRKARRPPHVSYAGDGSHAR